MKIIGGHDYYDGAGQGVDPGIVLVRTEAETDSPVPLLTPLRTRTPRARLIFEIALLGDRIIPLAIEKRPSMPTGRYRPDGSLEMSADVHRIHFDRDSVQAVRAEMADSAGLRGGYWTRTLANRVDAHFDQADTSRIRDWMITHQVSTGLIRHETPGDHANGHLAPAIAITGIAWLKDRELFRVIPPAEAHMTLSNWIGGVLPSHPDTVEISDADRVRKAGFDDASFRTPKGTKKPRRRAKT